MAHEIGRKTAERFGINGRAFMLCPTSYEYGCQNGFLEYAIAQVHATDHTARLLCGSLDQSYSAALVFRCYLGLGHGVLTTQDEMRRAMLGDTRTATDDVEDRQA